MVNLNDITYENNEKHKNWPFILDHPYIMLITGGSRSGKKGIIQFNKGTRRYW